MTAPCIITVAITGSLPTKADNPAVPIDPSIAWQFNSLPSPIGVGLPRRLTAQGQHIDAGSTQGARIIMICGHRLTSHQAKAPFAGWCDDAGVSSLRHSDYGRIIFCGHVRIRTKPRIRKVQPASRIRLAGMGPPFARSLL
jgi:hypothetical protein